MFGPVLRGRRAEMLVEQQLLEAFGDLLDGHAFRGDLPAAVLATASLKPLAQLIHQIRHRVPLNVGNANDNGTQRGLVVERKHLLAATVRLQRPIVEMRRCGTVRSEDNTVIHYGADGNGHVVCRGVRD